MNREKREAASMPENVLTVCEILHPWSQIAMCAVATAYLFVLNKI